MKLRARDFRRGADEASEALSFAREENAWVGVRFVEKKRNVANVLTVFEGHPPADAKAAGPDGPFVMVSFRAASNRRRPVLRVRLENDLGREGHRREDRLGGTAHVDHRE